MIDRTSLLIAIVVSMALAGLTSQTIAFSGVSKALTVGAVAAIAFVVIRSATVRRPA